jgi:hypothetical protein
MSAYIHADVLKVIHSPDARAKVDFLRRNDGLYEYRAYVERLDDGPAPYRYYWAPSGHSGLYETMEELERAAQQSVAWLREVQSADPPHSTS